MVKKLFKHEIISYLRVMSIVFIVLLAVSVFSRVIQFFESDSVIYNIISGFSIFTYVVAILAALGFAFVLSIVRFYKNLFTKEGYLTFTLPATSTQHIWVKATTAVLVQAVTFLVITLSICIITSGEVLTEIVNVIEYLFKLLDATSLMHIIGYLFEVILMFTASLFMSIFLYYLFISIGQMFRKNRILAAVGAYFVYYIINQVIATIISVFFAVYGDELPFEKLGEFFEANPYASIHIILITILTLTVIFTLIYFILVRLIINKKLNLE